MWLDYAQFQRARGPPLGQYKEWPWSESARAKSKVVVSFKVFKTVQIVVHRALEQAACQNGPMEPFTAHTGKTAVYAADNIDTDRVIPARFLTMVTRSGYGELLFKDVRGPEFALDQPAARGASVLVVGTNFGCGSSREHAVWAIQQAGFRAVIARRSPVSEGFSDIFRQNAANCGLLLIELAPADHERIASAGSGTEVTIDLPGQTVRLGEEMLGFEIRPALKDALVKGLDLIGTTLEYEAAIAAYEMRNRLRNSTGAGQRARARGRTQKLWLALILVPVFVGCSAAADRGPETRPATGRPRHRCRRSTPQRRGLRARRRSRRRAQLERFGFLTLSRSISRSGAIHFTPG